MPALPLKSMSIEKLSKLQAEVEAALSAKVVDERRELEAKLNRLLPASAMVMPVHPDVRSRDGYSLRGTRSPRSTAIPRIRLKPGRPRAQASFAHCRDQVRQKARSFTIGAAAKKRGRPRKTA